MHHHRRLRMKKVPGGGYVRLSHGGSIVPPERVVDFLRGAVNAVRTRAGPALVEGIDLLRKSADNVVQSSKEDIFAAINKRLSNLNISGKTGGAIRPIKN